MEFRILGPLDVLDEGKPVPLGRGRERALLALLLTRANEVVSVDRLIDELWGAEPPKAAVNTVQYYVSRLRKALGADRIVTRPPGYAVRVEPGELDLERFELLLANGGGEAVREALALWRGRRSPTSRSSRSHRRRSGGSRSSGSSRSSSAWTPISWRDGMPRS
jgi:DNA-binding SARP family transcriptional activator